MNVLAGVRRSFAQNHTQRTCPSSSSYLHRSRPQEELTPLLLESRSELELEKALEVALAEQVRPSTRDPIVV